MKTFAVYNSCDPDAGMIITVSNKNYKKAVKLCKIGLEAWFCISYPDYLEEYFGEDYEWIEFAGWAEPAEHLMEKAGIKYTLEDGNWDDCFDQEGYWKLEDIPLFDCCDFF